MNKNAKVFKSYHKNITVRTLAKNNLPTSSWLSDKLKIVFWFLFLFLKVILFHKMTFKKQKIKTKNYFASQLPEGGFAFVGSGFDVFLKGSIFLAIT